MSIDEKAFYAVKCDRCGGTSDDGEHTHWESVDTAREMASCADWWIIDGKDVCEDCLTAKDLEEDE